MQTHTIRTFEELTGPVIFVTENATGVKVRGMRYWLNRPRNDFEDDRAPQLGETWRFKYETVERADGDVARFVREEELIEDAAPDRRPIFDVPERPDYEDTEWFWLIRDERGGVYAQTYRDYIASDAWRRRADLRLHKDEYICQAGLPGCMTAATQVHHVTYNHLGCEPIWDLESVCGDCHALLTSIDRKKPMLQRNGQAMPSRE